MSQKTESETKWQPVGGGQARTFHKWTEPGEVLEGVWRGTVSGKFGLNGWLDTQDGDVQVSLSAGLRDLEEVPTGTRVRITFVKWAVSKGGNRFRLFTIERAAGGGQ